LHIVTKNAQTLSLRVLRSRLANKYLAGYGAAARAAGRGVDAATPQK